MPDEEDVWRYVHTVVFRHPGRFTPNARHVSDRLAVAGSAGSRVQPEETRLYALSALS